MTSGRGQPSSNIDRNSQEKMGMAWRHIEKAKHQRYETGLGVEPPEQAKEGRPKNTWRRDLEADITQTGLSWKQLERIAQDRRRWRDVVHGLCSRRSQVSKLTHCSTSLKTLWVQSNTLHGFSEHSLRVHSNR